MKKIFHFYLILILFLLTNFSIVLAQWTPQVSGTSENLFSMDFINDNTGLCVGSGGIILKTTNGGVNWAILPCPVVSNLNYVGMFNNSNIIIGVKDTSIFLKSTNGGINWSLDSLPNVSKKLQFVSFTHGFFIVNNIGHFGDFYRTTNGGQSWINYGFSFSGFYGYMKDTYFIDESTGWLCFTGRLGVPPMFKYVFVCKTSNAGENWTWLYDKQTFSTIVMTYRIFFVNFNLGFLTEYPYTACLYRTTNGGNNFQHNPSAGSEKIYSSMSFPSLDTGWFTGDQTIKTIDGGVNWDTITTPGGNSYKSVFFINNLTGWIAGDGGLIAKTTNGATNINGISNENPVSYALFQNYPNPFNPSTKIKFDLHKSSHTKLVIYNIIGKEVAILVNERLSAGSYDVDFNASGYPSGVYFYKLETEEYSNVKKMVLLK